MFRQKVSLRENEAGCTSIVTITEFLVIVPSSQCTLILSTFHKYPLNFVFACFLIRLLRSLVKNGFLRNIRKLCQIFQYRKRKLCLHCDQYSRCLLDKVLSSEHFNHNNYVAQKSHSTRVDIPFNQSRGRRLMPALLIPHFLAESSLVIMLQNGIVWKNLLFEAKKHSKKLLIYYTMFHVQCMSNDVNIG